MHMFISATVQEYKRQESKINFMNQSILYITSQNDYRGKYWSIIHGRWKNRVQGSRKSIYNSRISEYWLHSRFLRRRYGIIQSFMKYGKNDSFIETYKFIVLLVTKNESIVDPGSCLFSTSCEM